MNTEIISILDRSGSMSSIWLEATNGLQTFLTDQASVPGEARASLIVFDNIVDIVYAGKNLADGVPTFYKGNYGPRGMTAMRDAIGVTLEREGERIAAERWADKVIVCILTDGGENASRRYSVSKIKEMVGHAQAHGWEFIFLAANQDAVVAGAQYGFKAERSINFAATGAGASAAYQTMSATTRALRGTTF